MKRFSRLLLLAAVVACMSASFGCSERMAPGQSGAVARQVPIQHADTQHDADFP